MRVRRLFHGHQHEDVHYPTQPGPSIFKAFGVGLRGVMDVDGTVLVPGAADLRAPD
jgi:hypothetical protein